MTYFEPKCRSQSKYISIQEIRCQKNNEIQSNLSTKIALPAKGWNYCNNYHLLAFNQRYGVGVKEWDRYLGSNMVKRVQKLTQ